MFSNVTLKTILACTVLASSLTFGADAQAGTCKTVTFFPGVIQLYGTAKDSGSGDSALCTAVNACPSGARKVEVFGGAISTVPGANVAVSNVGKLTNGDEAIADCGATTSGGGIASATCNHTADEVLENQGTASEAECTLYTTAPVGGSVIANATCFCGE